MSHRPSVALLIETSNSYARGLLEGIIGYVRAHDPWSIWLPEQRRGESPPAWLRRWSGDGIIARIETVEIARALSRTKLPVVDVSAARPWPSVPWVETDDALMARMAAEHLLERGFRRLAFVGEPQFNWSVFREQHFIECCREAGIACEVFRETKRTTSRTRLQSEQRRLAAWLTQLEKPVGLWACYDIKAQQILDLCRELNLGVPEEVAVLGVDDDRLLCNLCTPPLSSVAPDSYRTGYVAAELLDRMLAGEAVSPRPHLIPPLGVVTRQSTDILAIEDADVAAALRLIREQAREGIDVGDVLRVIPVSRRVLETKFRKLVGRTPHEEILRVRLQRVRQLLLQTDLPIAEVAVRAGFTHPEYLTVAFRRELGVTPSVFRTQHGGHQGAGVGISGNATLTGTSSNNVGAS
jgi:LacI family transcriptional regulator